MIEEMRAELARLSAQTERRNKVDAMLQSLKNEEADLNRIEQELKYALNKEEADVDRLQRTTATSVLYAFLGKKDLKLSKEQQEAYAAKMKYDAAVQQLDDCLLRITALKQERDTLCDCEKQYQRVFSQLKEQLRMDPAYADKLIALESQRGEMQSQLRELDEAIFAGNSVMRQIGSIEDSLDRAEGWGTWDLLGGGLISDMAKHSNLDEAQESAEQLQVLLSRFRTELADVHISSEMGSLNIDGFLRFADYFFDGLFSDWAVQSRIHDSQESVYQVKCQVENALSKLTALKSSQAAAHATIEQKLTELVTLA